MTMRGVSAWALLLGLLSLPATVSAQTLTASLSSAVVDTTVSAAELTTGTAVLSNTLSLSVSACVKDRSLNVCRVYLSANLNAGSSVTNLRWSTTSSCASSTAVQSGTSPNVAGTFVYSLAATVEGATGSTTIYLCYNMNSLTWATAPSRTLYDLYFTVVRQ